MTPKARFDRFLRLPLAALGPAMALLAALFLLLEPAGVHAAGAVLYVSTAGQDVGACANVVDTPDPGWDGPCQTLQYAVAKSEAGDAIHMEAGSYAGGGVITRTLTIAGGYDVSFAAVTGESELQGGGADTVVSIQGAGVLTPVVVSLSHVALTGGAGSDGGGLSMGPFSDVTLTDVRIEGNNAAQGGGIYQAVTSTLTIAGISLIQGNQATGSGGGLFADANATLAITGAEVSGNTAEDGAGLFVGENSALTLSSVDLLSNAATGNGGGLFASTSVTLSVTGAAISGNTAVNGAGLFHGGNAPLTLSNVDLLSNTATGNGGGLFASQGVTLSVTSAEVAGNAAVDGGGLYHGGSGVLTLSSVDVITNTATGNGGGLFAGAGAAMTHDGGVVSRNTATGGGGGLFHGGIGALSLTNVDVISNTATGNGGGLFAGAGSALTHSGGRVAGNTGVDGGGIFHSGNGALTLTNVDLASNKATGQGGGLSHGGNGALALSSVDLISNTAAGDGGGFFAGAGAVLTHNGGLVSGNAAADGGGLFHGGSGALGLSNVDLISNTATGNGGGLFAGIGTTATVTAGDVSGNAAADGGGAYFGGGGLVSLAGTGVSSNSATGNGGGLYVGAATIAGLGSAQIIGNVAANGAGVYVAGTGSLTIAGNSALRSNRASGDGGALYLNQSSLLLSGSSIVTNTAARGGGIFASAAIITFQASGVVQDNAAGFAGGGIHISGGVTTTVTAPNVLGNSAATGGGIFVDNAFLAAAGGLIAQNRATNGTGGGIHVTAGRAFLTGAAVRQNMASASGGGIFGSGSDLALTAGASVAANGVLTPNGGGLYLAGGSLLLDNATVEQNRAPMDGGGIYAANAAVTLRNGTVLQTNVITGGRGGGLFMQGSQLRVDASTVAGNQAHDGGGGIYAAVLFAEVKNSTVRTNDGGYGPGGGIFVDADELRVTGNLLEQNVTVGHGGGLHIAGTPSATLTGNTLTGNRTREQRTVTVTELPSDVFAPGVAAPVARAGDIVTSDTITRSDGGGLFAIDSVLSLTNNSLQGNEAADEAAALYLRYSRATLVNNLIVQNRVVVSTSQSAGIVAANSALEMVHNTVADNVNTSPSNGTAAGIQVMQVATATATSPTSSQITLINNIIAGHQIGLMLMPGNTAIMTATLWGNTRIDWTGKGFFQTSALNRKLAVNEPSQPPGPGNPFEPLFVDAASGNFRIVRSSPAFDGGVLTAVTVDRDGTPRPIAFAPDIGAYEHRYSQGVYLDVDVNPRFANSGDTIQYTVRLKNDGLAALSGLRVTAALPGEQSGAGPSGACFSSACTLSPGQSASTEFSVQVSGSPAPGSLQEMVTTLSVAGVSGANQVDSDTAATLTTFLQSCRIQLAGVDYPTLQAAIDAANGEEAGDAVIKVNGYCGGPISVGKNLTLQGGWNASFTELNPTAYPSTVDVAGVARSLEVIGEFNPVIENLTLLNGSATGKGGGPAGEDAGGGIYISGGAAILRNIHVNAGSAALGGGMYIGRLSVPTIERASVTASSATDGGGGVYIFESAPKLLDITVSGNQAPAGGGFYLRKSQAQVSKCTISNNTSTGSPGYLLVAIFNVRLANGGGGGVHLDESPASFGDCVIANNSATVGGGIYADGSSAGVSNSTITGNSASGSTTIVNTLLYFNYPGGGGGIYGQKSPMSIQGNVITHNTASGNGGGLHFYDTDGAGLKISGNFLGFNSGGSGSAIYLYMTPQPFQAFLLPIDIPGFLVSALMGQDAPAPPKIVMHNNTIAHNTGSSAVYLYGESHIDMVNNIVARNGGTGVQTTMELGFYLLVIPIPLIGPIPLPFFWPFNPSAALDYTLFDQNGGNTSGPGISSQNVLSGDPAFKDDGYHIKRISVAYDQGRNTGLAVDLDGQPRLQGTRTDLGADEYPTLRVRYVAPGGAGAPPCTDYTQPCATLQQALDAARDGDLIKMAGGTHTQLTSVNGLTQMGYVEKSVTIQGGYFASVDAQYTDSLYTTYDWENPHPAVNPTILNAGGGGRLFTIVDPNLEDETEVKPILSGLQLTGGNAAGLGGAASNAKSGGGAIYVDAATVVITDVVASGNTADYGAGLYLKNANATVTHSRVAGNTANERGGGLYIESGEPTIEHLQIENNVGPRGGGVYVETGEPALLLLQITGNGNAGTVAGGGIYLAGGAGRVISNTVSGNRAADGGGLYSDGSEAQITGNTVRDNQAMAGAGRGGGVYIGVGAAIVSGNDVRANTALAGGGFYLAGAEATISGNRIEGNSATSGGGRGGGIYLRNTNDAILEENIIAGNSASGSGENDGGGGIYYESSTASTRANTVADNTARTGAGLYLFSGSAASLQHNEIRANRAEQQGGGVFVKLSDASFVSNTITANQVGGNGGGVFIKLSSATLTDNRIEGNQAQVFGGGLLVDESNARIEQGSIQGNQARDGGGAYVLRSDTAVLDQVSLRNNTASGNGGALYLRLSDIQFSGHVVSGNRATGDGGALYLDESTATVEGNLVRDNQAGGNGGALHLTNRSHASVVSNVIVDNRAGGSGSGVYIAGSSPSLVHNTVARNAALGGGDGSGVAIASLGSDRSSVTLLNTLLALQPVGIRVSQENSATVQYTLWHGNGVDVAGPGAVVTGTAETNVYGDPRFAADGFHLQDGSPAMGRAGPSTATRDVDGQARPQGSGPELGADEIPVACYAVASSDLNTVHTNVQAAIDAAVAGDEVRIAGTCIGVQVRAGLPQVAYVSKSITVRGGYTPTQWSTSYPITQPTVLDAVGEGRVFVLVGNAAVTVENLNIVRGDATGLGGGPGGLAAGGNIYVRDAAATVRNNTIGDGSAFYGAGIYLQTAASTTVQANIIAKNQATKGGGIYVRTSDGIQLRGNELRENQATDGAGIFLSFSPVVVDGNTVAANKAQAAGGGLFLEGSAATLNANIIEENQAKAAGGAYLDASAATLTQNTVRANQAENAGGIYLSQSNATLRGNRVLENSAGIGGGIYLEASTSLLVNNVVAKNQAQTQGSAIYVLSASPTLQHNTIADNSGGASAVHITDAGVNPSQVALTNNILAGHVTALLVEVGNSASIRANLWHGNGAAQAGGGTVTDSGGNLNGDPAFVDVASDDYRIANSSAGRDKAVDVGVDSDFEGQLRPIGDGPDMGADEFAILGIRLSMEAVPNPVVFGQPLVLALRAVNTGNVALDATIILTRPQVISASPPISWQVNIPGGGTWTQNVVYPVPPGYVGELETHVSVTTRQGVGDEETVTAQATAPDYAVSLEVDATPNPAARGSTLDYTIRVVNDGNLPLHPTVTAELAGAVSAAGPLAWPLAEMARGAAWTKTFKTSVAGDAAGALQTIFRVTSPEGAVAVYTTTVEVAEALTAIAVTVEPDPAVAGQPVTYTLTVTNAGNMAMLATITGTLPTDSRGQPLVAPGGPQVWSNVALAPGQVWTVSIVGVVQPGYVGPLTSQIAVASDLGTTTPFQHTTSAVAATPEVTIRAVASGAWDDPASWLDASGVPRVPNADDVVLVPAGITLDVAAEDYPITLQGLINRGVIRLASDGGQPAVLEIAGLLENSGEILGTDGDSPGEAGTSIEVTAATVLNSGVVRAGDGAPGDAASGVPDGGRGGAVQVLGQAVRNSGQIRAGDGAAGDDAASGSDGRGGDALLVAGPDQSAFLANTGEIAGGNSSGDVKGGDVVVLSAGTLVLDGGKQAPGRGADGAIDGAPGNSAVNGSRLWSNGVLGGSSAGFNFSFSTPIAVQGFAGGSVPIRLQFINRGAAGDRYYLAWTNTAGWPINGLPAIVDVRGLSMLRLPVGLTLPDTLPPGSRTVLQVTATSQGNPALVETHTVVVLVVQAGDQVFLPLIRANVTASAEPRSAAETEMPSPPAAVPLIPGEALSHHTFLPLVVYSADLVAEGSR